MKRMMLIATVLLMSVASFAQEKKSVEEFFLGKWQLMVEGLPTGDTEMLLVLNKDDNGELEGTIGGMDGSETTSLAKVKIEGSTLVMNFFSEGYNVPLYLDKEEDGSVVGSMNDMFDVTGKKFVEGQEN